MSNTSAEACEHAAVTKHNYRVTLSHTMGGGQTDEFEAGSKAHAALMAGIKLLATILERDPFGVDVALHNIEDHVNVDVELID